MAVLQKKQTPQIAIFMGPTRGPPGSCRPQVGPMLAHKPGNLGHYGTFQELCHIVNPRNYHGSNCFVIVWHQSVLPISFWVIALALGQWLPQCRLSKKNFLFSNRNFEIIWFSRSFWHFSPQRIQIIIHRPILHRMTSIPSKNFDLE